MVQTQQSGPRVSLSFHWLLSFSAGLNKINLIMGHGTRRAPNEGGRLSPFLMVESFLSTSWGNPFSLSSRLLLASPPPHRPPRARPIPTGLTVNSRAAEAPPALQSNRGPAHMPLLLSKMLFLQVFSQLPTLAGPGSHTWTFLLTSLIPGLGFVFP